MERGAVISDIHGNFEALSAVLEDARSREAEEIVCLGDIVGYGPDPVACVDLVRSHCQQAIRGNHDDALFHGAWGFNQLARGALDWTRKQLRPRIFSPRSRARWRFLGGLPTAEQWGEFHLAHGSPRDPTVEYVLPHHAAWPQPGMFEEIFASFSRVCFVGHTHVPGVFRPGPSFLSAAEISGSVPIGEEKLMVNVGSVGQPRDQDPRACYVLVEGDEIRFRRVDYPVEVTQAKIRAISSLDDRLADRLSLGE